MRFLTMFALASALVVPAGLVAQERDRDHQETRRYEDKAHNDSHDWNDNENQAYRRYLQEHHKKYHDFAKANKRDQEQYWEWRHSHPDGDHK